MLPSLLICVQVFGAVLCFKQRRHTVKGVANLVTNKGSGIFFFLILGQYMQVYTNS